jgi:hypothetical protein
MRKSTGLLALIAFPLVGVVTAGAVVVNAGHPNCAKVKRNFHGAWGNLDDYVQSFPRVQQRRVLKCLRAST